MKILALISGLMLSLTASAQQGFDVNILSPAAKTLLSDMNHNDVVSTDTMATFGGFLPKDYPLNVLREQLPLADIVELTSHPVPAIRCYAFKALTMTDEPETFKILTQHLSDTAIVKSRSGCLGSSKFVADFFVDVYRGRESVTHDSTHLRVLDSLLIFIDNKLEARSTAFLHLETNERYYRQVRHVVITDPNFGALIALARYKNTNDISLIANTHIGMRTPNSRTLSYIVNIRAMQEFNHPDFIPYLELFLVNSISEAEGSCRMILLALAKYETQSSCDVMSLVFDTPDQQIRASHLASLDNVLASSSHPIFHQLKKRLKEELH